MLSDMKTNNNNNNGDNDDDDKKRNAMKYVWSEQQAQQK